MSSYLKIVIRKWRQGENSFFFLFLLDLLFLYSNKHISIYKLKT